MNASNLAHFRGVFMKKFIIHLPKKEMPFYWKEICFSRKTADLQFSMNDPAPFSSFIPQPSSFPQWVPITACANIRKEIGIVNTPQKIFLIFFWHRARVGVSRARGQEISLSRRSAPPARHPRAQKNSSSATANPATRDADGTIHVQPPV
jgi:hypothetical protein